VLSEGVEPSILAALVSKTNVYANSTTRALEQSTGFEPVRAAWKAAMLTVEHQPCIGESRGNRTLGSTGQSRLRLPAATDPLESLAGVEPAP
jgi:hypothetical protein